MKPNQTTKKTQKTNHILFYHPVLTPSQAFLFLKVKVLQIPQFSPHRVLLPSTLSAESLDTGPLQAGGAVPLHWTCPAKTSS